MHIYNIIMLQEATDIFKYGRTLEGRREKLPIYSEDTDLDSKEVLTMHLHYSQGYDFSTHLIWCAPRIPLCLFHIYMVLKPALRKLSRPVEFGG